MGYFFFLKWINLYFFFICWYEVDLLFLYFQRWDQSKKENDKKIQLCFNNKNYIFFMIFTLNHNFVFFCLSDLFKNEVPNRFLWDLLMGFKGIDVFFEIYNLCNDICDLSGVWCLTRVRFMSGVLHRHMWLHSITFICLNYYRCLMCQCCVLASSVCTCAL
jgi:hypothetical protein